MTTNLPQDVVDELTRMIAVREARRAQRVATALKTLRPYERRLLREAAVMGYVLGDERGRLAKPSEAFPKDVTIVATVINHCDSNDGTFPFIAAACGGRRRRVTRVRMWASEVRWAEESKAGPRPGAEESKVDG